MPSTSIPIGRAVASTPQMARALRAPPLVSLPLNRTITTAIIPRSTPQGRITRPRCTTKAPSQDRTLFSASTSSAIEGSWLSKHSKHAKGGAVFAAKQSPKAQLVAAEEGLNPWLAKSNSTSTSTISPSISTSPQGTASMSTMSTPTLPQHPWNYVPPSEPSSSLSSTTRLSPIRVGIDRPVRSAYESVREIAPPAPKDDTPGLIAFSAFLLLPLAFQLGRYFEGKEDAAALSAAGATGATKGPTAWTADALPSALPSALWEVLSLTPAPAVVDRSSGEEVVRVGGEGRSWGNWFWATDTDAESVVESPSGEVGKRGRWR